MKILISLILLMALSTVSYAVDFTNINEESMAVFLEIYPKYKAILGTYRDDLDPSNETASSKGYSEEVKALLAEYEITMLDLSQMIRNVTKGYFEIKLQQQVEEMGADDQVNMAIPENELKEEEKGTLKNNIEALDDILQ